MRIPILVIFFISLLPFNSIAQSFQQQSLAENKSISGVFMVNASVGYAGGVDGIYKTMNGGQNWDLLPFFVPTGDYFKDYIPGNFNKIHLHFFNESKGFAYGWHSFNAELIMRTSDGGLTWTVSHYFIPDSPNYNFNELNSLHVWNSSTMIIAGNSSRILFTSDGGDNWVGMRLNAEETDLRRIQFTSETHGYAGGERRLYISNNAGQHWTFRKLNFTLSDFHFFDELNGLAISEEGNFYSTSDGGNTWVVNLMQASVGLRHLEFADNLNGFATGYSGVIYKTTDGGNTWLKVYADGNEISSGFLLTANNVWFSVEKGYLLHSQNGGSISVMPPSITSANPPSGEIGYSITLDGSNLSSVLGIKFNGQFASFKLSGGSITTTVPRGTTTGKIELIWSGGSVFSTFDFVVSQKPQLYAPSPNLNTVGKTIVIQGENLQYVTRLTLKDVDYSFSVLNSKAISFTIPGDFNTYVEALLQVYSPYGTASLSMPLASLPLVTNKATSTAPGKSFTITGSDLFLTTEVKFGTVPATSFEVISNTEITCIVPDVSTKITAPVYVTTPGGRATSIGDVTIYPAPVLTSVSPLNIKAGEELKIEGLFLPSTKWQSTVIIGPYRILEPDVRYDSDHTLFVKVPRNLPVGDVDITLTNEGGLTTTKSFPITVTGELPHSINYVDPVRTQVGKYMVVKGVFPHVDSLTVGGKRQTINQYADNFLYFTLGSNALEGGYLTLYVKGEPISYSEELIISDNQSPYFDFSPKIASVGTRITVTPRDVRFIKSIKVNGQSVPFEPNLSVGYDFDVSFMVTEGITSGRVTLTTIDGVYEAEGKLEIKPASEIKPIITKFDYGEPAKGYILKLLGHNFTNVTNVRMDKFNTGFIIQHDDTLLIKMPENIAPLYFNTYNVIVESPAGQADIMVWQTSYPTQTILSATPSSGQRGSIVTIKLTEQKPYIFYNSYPTFFFGNTYTQRYNKVDDTTYLVEAPQQGEIEGKIGINGGSGYTHYSDVEFKLTKENYCTSIGGGTQGYVNGLKKLMLQGVTVPIDNTPYIDNTADPIVVNPGQFIRVGITPSTVGVVAKVFVDWNDNKEFDEPGVLMVSGSWLPPQDTMIYFILNVPATVASGSKARLRIVSAPGSTDDLLPCGLRIGGQVIDYQINIINTNPNGRIATGSRQYRSGDSITPLSNPVDLNQIWRATIDDKDVPYFTLLNPGSNEVEIHTVQEFPEDGELCVYHITDGKYCYPDKLRFPSYIDFPIPFDVRVNQTVILTGRNLSTISRVVIDDKFEAQFSKIDEHSFSFIVPESNLFSHHISITDSWGTIEKQISYVQDMPLCDPYTGWNEGAEIISVKFNEIENVSGKNTTGGRADYSDQVAIVEQYNSYYTDVVVKNFSNVTKFVSILVVINGTDTLGTNFYKNGAAGVSTTGIPLEPNTEATLHVYISIPSNIPLNQNVGCWFVLNYYSYSDYCVSRIGEIEQYSIYIKKNQPSTMKISSLSKTVAGVNDQIVLTGTSLNQVKSLKIGDLYIPFTLISPQSIQFTVPSLAITNNVTVVSLNSEAQSPERLTIIQPHAITSIEPRFGKTGDAILLRGTNLANVKNISVGNISVSNFSLLSNNSIRITIPSSAKTGPISLKNEFNQSVNSETFYYCDGLSFNQFCKADQQITFADLNPVAFGKTPFHLVATASSSLPISYVSSNNSVATISGNMVTVVGPGSTIITAKQSGNDVYNAAVNIQKTLVVNKADQAITFNDLGVKKFGQLPFQLTAQASSFLPISYSSSNALVATISGSTVTIVGAGSATMTAKQSGNSFYNSAADVIKIFVVEKALQNINFSSVPDVLLSTLPITLNATASSGLKISFTSNNAVTITDTKLTSTNPGRISVNASQNGNTNYEAAIQAEQSFCIIPNKPIIAQGDTSPDNSTLISSSNVGNHWFRDDVEIQGLNTKSIVIDDSGTYKVRVSADDCISEFSEAITIIITALEEKLKTVFIYPNPVKGKMLIETSEHFTELRLTSLTGEILKSISISTSDQALEVDVNDLKSGVYVLELITKEKVFHRQKFIRE